MRCLKAGLWASFLVACAGCGGQSTGSTPEPSEGPNEPSTGRASTGGAASPPGSAPTAPLPPPIAPEAPSGADRCASGELDQKLQVSLKSAQGAVFLFTRGTHSRCADGSEAPLTAFREYGCGRLSLQLEARSAEPTWAPSLYVHGGLAALTELTGQTFVGDIRYLTSSSPARAYLQGTFEIAPRDGSAAWTGSFLVRTEDASLVDPCRDIPLEGGAR